MDAEASRARELQDATFMTRALELAELAVSRGQTPFGAVVVDPAGQVVGEGHNTVRADLDPTAHGEVVAIRAAWRRLGAWQRLRGTTLYTTCEPCLLCSFVIAQIDIRRVVFAARATDVPGYRPLLGTDLTGVAAWMNMRPDWTPLEIVPDYMRERALAIIDAFPWREAGSRGTVRPSS